MLATTAMRQYHKNKTQKKHGRERRYRLKLTLWKLKASEMKNEAAGKIVGELVEGKQAGILVTK